MQDTLDIAQIRKSFPSLERSVNGTPAVYLDGPGGSQVPDAVITAISDYYRHSNANSHGPFVTSQETDRAITGARQAMADFVHAADGGTISFGANMTSLNFQLARAVARSIRPGDEVVVTDLDHDANVAPWLTLAERGAVIRQVPLASDGVSLDWAAFQHLLSPKTKWVAVGWASNAIGTINPMAQIRSWTREVGARLVVDAVHYAPHQAMDAAAVDPDFLLCSAYKFFGPHVGILYGRPGALDTLTTDKVRPQVSTAPEKIETGTLNHAALAGVTAAVDFIAGLTAGDGTRRERVTRSMQALAVHEAALFERLWRGLSTLPRLTLYGVAPGSAPRTPTVGFTVRGLRAEDVNRRLAEAGIFAWDGDFYASTLVDHLGIRPEGGLVRMGLSVYSDCRDVDRTLAVMGDIAG